ncbi:MAG: hypothetical protein DWQ01_20090 [Planctomycetota bacterium]|nr:MAG: hypothetical protein DWQ01_20090 [Planctomycetota bacterium]
MTETDQVHITAEPQADPRKCLFRVDRTLYVGMIYTSDPAFAESWMPLAKALFDANDQIQGVRIAHGELTVRTAEAPDDWRELARACGAAIRAHLQAGHESVKEGAEQHLAGDDAIRHRVQQVIDSDLNPALAAHGGFVEILDNDGLDFYLNMGGGCQGCGAAAATMRQGIEVAIREKVPEVGNIFDGTDHAAGTNPYM